MPHIVPVKQKMHIFVQQIGILSVWALAYKLLLFLHIPIQKEPTQMKKILYFLLITLTFAPLSFAQDSPQWHLPEGAKMRLGKGTANEIAYSPDGTKLAVASGIGIWIYDAQTGEELDLFPANRFEVRNIAFSPDGSMLASDSFDSTINYWSIENRTVRLWDVKSRRQIRTFTGHLWPITCLAFSPDGKTIASGSVGTTVRVWDVASGRQLHRLWEIGSQITSVVFSPDGKTLAASGARDKFFRLWDVETGGFEQTQRFEGHTEGVSSLAFHPDGQLIASGSSDNTFRLWDVETGRQRRSFTKHADSVYAVTFSPDGKTLASGGRDNNIWLTNVFNGTSRGLLSGHTDSIRTVVFGQDSYTLASRSSDGTIHLWNDITGNGRVGWERHTITGHIDHVESIAFSPDGNTLVSSGWNKVMQLWHVNTGTKQHVFVGHTAHVSSVVFSPDGSTIASGSYDGTVRLWDTDTSTEPRTLINISGNVESVAFSPDGKTVACVATVGDYNPMPYLRDSNIYLFDVETGSERHKIAAYKASLFAGNRPEFHPTEHTKPVIKIAFSPHGNMLASSSYDKTIRLWHVQTGEYLRVLTKQADNAYSFAFSPDGRILASGSREDTIRLWDVASGMQIKTLTGHTDYVNSIAFSPDADVLASGSDDSTVRLWDVASDALLRTFTGNIHTAYTIAFSPDGSTVASGNGDGTILLWDLNAPLPSNTTVGFSPVSVESPIVGEQLTLSLNIAAGQNVAGYQATVHFDSTALRFVESSNGDYLPAAAYVMPPVVEGDRVMLAATTFGEESNADGTLATITFEVIATKSSTVRLSDVILTDSAGNSISPKIIASTEITEPMFLPKDVNKDGVVNILDLVSIAANFGKTGKNDADINRDGVVNIVDLTLVAAAIGDADMAAPVLQFHNQEAARTRKIRFHDQEVTPTRGDIAAWLKEARALNLSDPDFQSGILVLESLLKALTPKETTLLANYPNPFNPETWIPYQLATPAAVKITIYTADGKLVRTLGLGHQPVGMYQHRSRAAYWNGKNALGEPVASGMYFYTLSAGQFSATRKMLIRK